MVTVQPQASWSPSNPPIWNTFALTEPPTPSATWASVGSVGNVGLSLVTAQKSSAVIAASPLDEARTAVSASEPRLPSTELTEPTCTVVVTGESPGFVIRLRILAPARPDAETKIFR